MSTLVHGAGGVHTALPARPAPRSGAEDRRPGPAAPLAAAVGPVSGPAVAAARAPKADIAIGIVFYLAVSATVIGVYLGCRAASPQAFSWGLRLVDLPLALTGLGLVLLAALMISAAAYAAARGRQRTLVALTALTLLTLLGYLGVQTLDWANNWMLGLRPGPYFRPNERWVARQFGVKLPRQYAAPVRLAAAPAPVGRTVSAENGRSLFLGTCATCHGASGQGMPGYGKDLRTSQFVASLDDAKLLGFLKEGRQPWDPLNTTKVQMPPRGGNPMLKDDDLRDIVAFLRTLQKDFATAAASGAGPAPPGASEAASRPAAGAPVSADALSGAAPPAQTGQAAAAAGVPGASSDVPSPPGGVEFVERSVVPAAAIGPEGTRAEVLAEIARPRWKPPAGASTFTTAYFLITQFQAAHVVALVAIVTGLLVRALRGAYGPGRWRPLLVGAAACWWVALLLLGVFPFVYLV